MPRTAVRLKRALPNVVKFMTDFAVAPSMGMDPGVYIDVSGYRTLNITVQFSQTTDKEPPVDVQVMFAYDKSGKLAAGQMIDAGQNIPAAQKTNPLYVSGAGSWHGNPWNVSTFMVRVPVMAPYAKVIAYNTAPFERTVTVWGHLEK